MFSSGRCNSGPCVMVLNACTGMIEGALQDAAGDNKTRDYLCSSQPG